jgi:hypothetical protein
MFFLVLKPHALQGDMYFIQFYMEVNQHQLKKHKDKKQSSKYEEGILASTRYFTITRQF